VNCTAAIRELSNYMDGSLESSIRQEIERHLQHCRDCTVVLHQTQTSIEILVRCKPAALPSDVRERLHQKLRDKIGKRPD
jgi:anti-sigma factor RsiW